MAAANAVARVVVDYAPDPHDARGLFAYLRDVIQGRTVHPYEGDDYNPSTTFHGDAGRNLQNFRGAVAPAANAVTYRNGAYADISSGIVEGPLGDPARKMFADRLRRRSAL